MPKPSFLYVQLPNYKALQTEPSENRKDMWYVE